MKQCIECNKEFKPKHFNEKLCSKECRKIRLKKMKLMEYHRNKKQHHKSSRNWFLKNKGDKLQKNKIWRENNPERMRQLQRNWHRRKHNEISQSFGESCTFCKRKPKKVRLVLHEIHDKKHSSNPSYYPKHREDFILICRYCHNGIHFLINILGMNPQKAIDFIKQHLAKRKEA